MDEKPNKLYTEGRSIHVTWYQLMCAAAPKAHPRTHRGFDFAAECYGHRVAEAYGLSRLRPYRYYQGASRAK